MKVIGARNSGERATVRLELGNGILQHAVHSAKLLQQTRLPAHEERSQLHSNT
jgi:hypothetical protein